MGNVNTHIVKVQLPISTNRRDAVALVYERDRRNLVEQPIPQHVRDAMKGDKRAFFEATLNEVGRWNINRRLPEQLW